MKISLDWLREYIDIELPVEQIAAYLTESGLEVEGVEEVQRIPGGMKGLVIGEVLTVTPHENADKLKVTTVDTGRGEISQIVCGAPNVAAGQKVVVALPGTIIYPLQGEPFEIKKAKIRGVESSGMICAEDEIGIGSGHDGIMVLDGDAQIGESAAGYFNLESDHVFEIGLTPNRSDANSHIGVARDLGAFLNFNAIQDTKIRLPEAGAFSFTPTGRVEVEVRNKEACPRYAAVLIKDVEIKPSPEWLRKRLLSIGIKSINNVVDITNFVLHETGQPLHAFDASRIKGHRIVVDTVERGTDFTTLDGQHIRLEDTDLMILDADGEGLCLAGVYGGKDSGVTESTRDIILECAHFELKGIRRTSMRHNLRTDAARTFEKGTDPNSCASTLLRAAGLIIETAGGRLGTEVTDIYPVPIEKAIVEIDCLSVNRLLGLTISAEEYRHLFACLDFEVYRDEFPEITLRIPTYKTDVRREADVAEEVLRIYGLNKVPLPQFMQIPNITPELITDLSVKKNISEMLHGMGYMESMSLSFSQSKYVKDLEMDIEEELVYVNNTSNTHLDILRPTMVFSVLENIQYNQNRQQRGARFYEFGRKYIKKEGRYEEIQQLALVLWGKKNPDHWKKEFNGKYDFYDLKAYVDNLLKALGIEKYRTSAIGDDVFGSGQRRTVGDMDIVVAGSVNRKLQKYFDIKDDVFIALFNWDNAYKILKRGGMEIKEISKFPAVSRDFSLVVDEKTTFGEIEQLVLSAGRPLAKSCSLFDIYRDEKNVGREKKSYAISVMFEDPAKTLTDKEIEKVAARITEQLSKRLSAEIRN